MKKRSLSSITALLLVALPSLAMPALASAAPPAGQVLGYYENGKLQNASRLPAEGRGFIHLFGHRACYYGSEGLVELIEQVSSELEDRYPGGERLQVGDLSREHGGEIWERHVSHQNGLDVDMIYLRRNHREQVIEDPANGFDEFFVRNGKLSSNFDKERNFELFRLLVETGRVELIFVDTAIKKAMCIHAQKTGVYKSSTETLRRLIPYPKHDDHLHVRLNCPKDSPKCIPYKKKIPAGNGCAELFQKAGSK